MLTSAVRIPQGREFLPRQKRLAKNSDVTHELIRTLFGMRVAGETTVLDGHAQENRHAANLQRDRNVGDAHPVRFSGWPGFELTLDEAERRFHIERGACEAILKFLVNRRVLARDVSGRYRRYFPARARASAHRRMPLPSAAA